jgi:hypothetical protein
MLEWAWSTSLDDSDADHEIVSIAKARGGQASVLLILQGDAFASNGIELLCYGVISDRE